MPSLPKRGDWDGFVALALDNLVQFLLIVGLCLGVLRFPSVLVMTRVAPAAALGLAVGSCYFARAARRCGTAATALPFGISTIALFANVFLVMLPAREAALALGHTVEDAALGSWRLGLAVAFCVGVGVGLGSFVVTRLRRVTPEPALLSTLSGMALCFIAGEFAARAFANPLVALLPFGIVLCCYAAGHRAPWGAPAGAWALLTGTAAAWLLALSGAPSPLHVDNLASALTEAQLALPSLALADLWHGLTTPELAGYLVPVALPLVIANVLGSLQNLASAARAGDDYPAQPSLLASGLCTMLSATLGSGFPNTIYIGHPGWKGFGARASYAELNGLFFVLITFAGLLPLVTAVIPLEAGFGLMVWIGISVAAQSLQGASRGEALAVVVGIIPVVIAWATSLLSRAVTLAQHAVAPQLPDTQAFAAFIVIANAEMPLPGLVALAQGFMLTGIIWAAALLYCERQQFRRAAGWLGLGAALAFFGFVHAGSLGPGGPITALGLGSGWRWALGYGLCALFCLTLERGKVAEPST